MAPTHKFRVVGVLADGSGHFAKRYARFKTDDSIEHFVIDTRGGPDVVHAEEDFQFRQADGTEDPSDGSFGISASDLVLMKTQAHLVLWGGEGDDFLLSGSGNDHIYGEAGNDYLEGGMGDDVVEGGPGDDFVLGDTRSSLSSRRKITVRLLDPSKDFQKDEIVRDTYGTEGIVKEWNKGTFLLTVELTSLEDFRKSKDQTYDLEGASSGAQATIEDMVIDFTGIQPPAVPLPAASTTGDPVRYEMVKPEDPRIVSIRLSLSENKLPGVDLQGSSPASLEDAYALTYVPACDFVVSTRADENDGNYSDGDLSLREALSLARLASGPNTIGFADSLRGAVITLDSDLGPLVIDSDVTVRGTPAHPITLDGHDTSGILRIAAGVTVTLSDMVITKSKDSAIHNDGNLTVSRIAVVDNTATYSGGGIYNDTDATLIMTQCEVSGNSAASRGGGIANWFGVLRIECSTISGNEAGTGGGIDNWGMLTLVNSTVSGNQAHEGGGLCTCAQVLNVINSTITNNVGWSMGGGLYIDNYGVSPSGILSNTIVAGNRVTDATTGQDVYGTFSASSSYNLIGIIDGSVNLTGTGTLYGTTAAPRDAGLGPLADNGGVTLTHALLPGSPAREAGRNALAVDSGGHLLTTDQRGHSRFYDLDGDGVAQVDIGACELDALPVIDQTHLPRLQSIGDFNGDGYEDFLAQGLGADGSSYILLGPVVLDGRVPIEQKAQIAVDPRLGRLGQFRGDLGGPKGVAKDGFDDLAFVCPYVDSSMRVAIFWGRETAALPGRLTDGGDYVRIFMGSPFEDTDDMSVSLLDWDGDSVNDILISRESVPAGYGSPTVAALYTLAEVNNEFKLILKVRFNRESTSSGALTAINVAPIGDANGDGKDDLVFGDPSYSTGSGNANLGRVCVFAGRSYSASGESIYDLNNADLILVGAGSGAMVGADVAPLGDVNGDGLADFAVGAPGYALPGGGRRGMTAIVYGSRSLNASGNLYDRAGVILRGDADSGAPWRLTAGDFDGNGATDLCVAWPTADGGGTIGLYYDVASRAWEDGHVVLTLQEANLQINGEIGTGPLGVCAETSQLDLNNDHIHDVIVSGGRATDGRIYVLYGRRATWSYDRAELKEIRGHIQENLANDAEGKGYLVGTPTGTSTVFPLPAIDGTQSPSYEVNRTHPERWFTFTTRGDGGGITAGADDNRDTNLIRFLDPLDEEGQRIAEGYTRTVSPTSVCGTVYEITPQWYESTYDAGVILQGRDYGYVEYGIMEYDLSTFFAHNGEVVTSALLTVKVDSASSSAADGKILVRLLELPVDDGDGIALEADMRLTSQDGTANGTVVGELSLPSSSSSSANGVSADGQVVVGGCSDFINVGAFVWTADAVRSLHGGMFAAAAGVSSNGRVVVGEAGTLSYTSAFRWIGAC